VQASPSAAATSAACSAWPCWVACTRRWFFTGDILLLYSVLGVLIWPLRKLSPRGLIKVALLMVLVENCQPGTDRLSGGR